MATNETSRKIISREEAAKLGLKRFFIGKRCKHGHVDEWIVSNNYCCECSREHDRRYAKANPEKLVLKEKRRYAKDPERHKARRRTWYKENHSYALQYAKEYREENRETINAKQRIRSAEFRRENPERAKFFIDQWWSKNPGRKKTYHRNRKARKRGNGGSHTAKDVSAIFKSQHGRCAYCRKKLGDNYHVDHIIPLIAGGSNDRTNLQILCVPCNLAKGARDPIDHARSLGMLL